MREGDYLPDGLPQILDDILRVLQPAAQPEESVGDAQPPRGRRAPAPGAR